jgi:TonB-linked SusC/RagA family outer membrane protein
MNKLIIYLFLAAIILPGVAWAQGRVVTGVVRDSYGVLPGATVTEAGDPTNTVEANAKGEFKIVLRGTSNAVVVTYVNYVRQTISLKGRTNSNLEIKLEQNTAGMDEVTVVGFGVAKARTTMTGAVSSINAKEIEDVPTSSVQNALAGRLPGLITTQRSGQPGRDASDFYIRGISSLNPNGNEPLILVDDIEYTYDQLSQINVNEIETITILKDASSTAIYGIKGANGVLLVTTKRGQSGRPKFVVRVESGLQSPVKTPQFLDAYQSAVLVNQAYNNDGIAPIYTQNDLNLFKSGTDPYGHPNVNWYKTIMSPTSEQANGDLSVSGGTHNVRYFISGGAFTQNGTVKNFQSNEGDVNSEGVNSNYFYDRYNVRSNLDIQATKNLTLRMDMTTRYMDINQSSNINVLGDIYNYADYHPFSAPFINPNGSYAYAYDTQSQLPTLNALLAQGGYTRDRRTDFNTLIGFDEKLNAITQGLALTGRLAYASEEENVLSLTHAFGFPPSYHYNPANQTYTLNTGPSGGGYVEGNWVNSGYTDIDIQTVNAQVFLSYDRTFDKAHHFNSLLLWNQQNMRVDEDVTTLGTVTGQVPQKYRGYSIKLGYDYKQKYLIDFNAAYNGSDRFQAKKRNGFFPAAGLGWNLAKERFFGEMFPKVNLFKLRATYGVVGSDVALGNQYLYQQLYYQGSQYSFGTNPQDVNTIYEGSLGNNNVTWEKSRKFDAGLDMNLFGDKISSTTDYFHEYRFDQLVTPGNVPLILGIGLSPSNVGITTNQGWEETITYKNTVGKVFYSVGIVYSHNKNKIIYEAEAAPRFPWLAQTGHQINQPFGYVYQGFYSAADIANAKVAKPNTATAVQQGDLKYKDINGDGFIDQNDETAIGRPNIPNTTVGFPIKLGYKGFDLSVMFQGAFQYSLGLNGTAIEPFQSQWQPIHELAWTPETANSAQFPRLTSNPTTINSPTSYNSSFWLVNAHYIRLKTVDFSYQFPKNVIPFHLSSARLYLSAYNLLTWSNVAKKYQQDPETESNTVGDAYLTQKVLNLGLQVGF